MLKNLLVAVVVAFAVVYFGDPYSPENRGRLPWLPPEIPETALVEMRDSSIAFFEGIKLEETYQSIAEHALTQEAMTLFDSLRARAWRFILEFGADDKPLLAKMEE